MDLQFNLGYPGPQADIPDWVGHITIDGHQYGMAFFNIGTGKPFDSQNSGKNVFFGELWFIYESITLQFNDNGVLTSWSNGSVLLAGNDQGVVTLANFKYHMNGEVTTARGGFQAYLGNQVHMSGEIQWYSFGAPRNAPGEFRIN